MIDVIDLIRGWLYEFDIKAEFDSRSLIFNNCGIFFGNEYFRIYYQNNELSILHTGYHHDIWNTISIDIDIYDPDCFDKMKEFICKYDSGYKKAFELLAKNSVE